MASKLPQLLTIPEVASRLSISQMHVYRLIASGVLESVDVAAPGSRKSKTRVPEAALAEFVRRRTRPGRRTA